jgi:hypothetical protein
MCSNTWHGYVRECLQNQCMTRDAGPILYQSTSVLSIIHPSANSNSTCAVETFDCRCRALIRYSQYPLVMCWVGLARKPVALASGIFRPSHRDWLWPGFGLAWSEPWLMRWQCYKFYVLQGDKPRAPKKTLWVHCCS